MFIEANTNRPFFVYLAHHPIHTPLQTHPETRARLADRAKVAGVEAMYMGCTCDLDDGVGLLLAKLKELNLETNTLLVFTADNRATEKSSQEPLRRSPRCTTSAGRPTADCQSALQFSASPPRNS